MRTFRYAVVSVPDISVPDISVVVVKVSDISVAKISVNSALGKFGCKRVQGLFFFFFLI